MQMDKSHPVKKSKFSSSKHVLALPLWTPDTLYYSFADITVGAWPYFLELKEKNILENHQAVRQGTVLALQLTLEVLLVHMDTSRALQTYGQDVKQYLPERYHSNCSRLWRTVDPRCAAEDSCICSLSSKSIYSTDFT